MDAATIAALAGKAAQLNILYLVAELLIVAAALAFVVFLGERALGFDLKEFVDNVEKRADEGDLWPGVVCFVIVPAALGGIVLFLALR